MQKKTIYAQIMFKLDLRAFKINRGHVNYKLKVRLKYI